jgi:hypothetical protein
MQSCKILTLVAASLLSIAVVRGLAQPGQSDARVQRLPVLVELFTSEGCSDCPPADALLADIDAKQPVPGVKAIVLSEHVTYWNHLGWRDPFSLDAMTQRQAEYVRRFGLDSAYTPQMVVDGTTQFVGSDGRALVAALSKSAARPKISLAIENASWDHGSVHFALRGEKLAIPQIVAVIAADATRSEVARGENAGRTLHHTAVVRAMKVLSGKEADGRSLTLDSVNAQQTGTTDGKMRLVVFAVDRTTGHVLGAAEQTLQ